MDSLERAQKRLLEHATRVRPNWFVCGSEGCPSPGVVLADVAMPSLPGGAYLRRGDVVCEGCGYVMSEVRGVRLAQALEDRRHHELRGLLGHVCETLQPRSTHAEDWAPEKAQDLAAWAVARIGALTAELEEARRAAATPEREEG